MCEEEEQEEDAEERAARGLCRLTQRETWPSQGRGRARMGSLRRNRPRSAASSAAVA